MFKYLSSANLIAKNVVNSRPLCTQALSGILGRLNHVAIACPDLEKASKFYKDLGANVSDPVPQKEHGVYTVFVNLGNSKIELLHPFGEKSPIQNFLDKNKAGGIHHPQKEHGVYTVFVNLGNSKIELLHPFGEKSPIQNFLDKNKAGGIHHVCIEVKNIDEAIKKVKELGVRTLGDKPKIGAHGKPVIFLHPKDCLGVLTELEQV
uniref:VOC domain-containing protein n=1 Tax=Panagrolaimus sp. JU765 TaxID=591449 RepID=A0AC34QL86_9BILA